VSLSLKLSSCLLSVFLVSLLAAQEMHPPARSTPAFDQLKSLAGEWQGKDSSGKTAQLTYKVVSNGSVVMERLAPATEAEMITMYSLEGNRIVVTHYCSAGNQPRMRAEPAAGDVKQLDFRFLDVTNLASPDAGHMHELVVSFEDANHFTQEWHWLDHGKESVEAYHFVRKQ